MNYSKSKYDNWVCKFNSPISIDNGTTNKYQGDFDSEMELMLDYDEEPHLIEWDNPIEVIGIGLEYNSVTKQVEGYDGVFELPIQAIKLIEKAGFKVSKDLYPDEIV